MNTFLTSLELIFGVCATALMIRSAWLLFRGDYKRGSIHVAIAILAFGLALAFHFAKSLFETGG
jgi:hypothetical protein